MHSTSEEHLKTLAKSISQAKNEMIELKKGTLSGAFFCELIINK